MSTPSLMNPPSSPINRYVPTFKPSTSKVTIPTLGKSNSINFPTSKLETKGYQDVVIGSSLENELGRGNYTSLGKIIVKNSGSEDNIQYVKAVNQKGKKLYIIIDSGDKYISSNSSDLIYMQPSSIDNIIPYSLKMGAFTCVGAETSGVAFECGTDSICIMMRGTNDIAPKEHNFTALDNAIPYDSSKIIPYPMVRLSEIIINPQLTLQNTDVVTKRLRNGSYAKLSNDLVEEGKIINDLSTAFDKFDNLRKLYASKLSETSKQLEAWNDMYMQNPASTDDNKDKFQKIQYNLIQRNEGIVSLLQSMDIVSNRTNEIKKIVGVITAVTEKCEKDFVSLDKVNSD